MKVYEAGKVSGFQSYYGFPEFDPRILLKGLLIFENYM
jgi:hypothetical protein